MITKKSDTQKKFPVILAAGAMLAPLLNPITAQAETKTPVQNQIRLAQSGSLTLRGLVTQDLPGNEFNFRADDGRTFRVVTHSGEPRWLSQGDRIEVRGQRDGDLLVATSLRVLTDRTGNVNTPGSNTNANRLTLRGAVTQDLAGNQFYFRADDGRTFRVTTRNAQPGWISRGDRVEIRGWREGDLFIAENVRQITNNGNGNTADRLTLSGVVTQSLSGNQFSFRTDDGRDFRISPRGNRPNRVSVNDRVEVRGWREGNIINADSVRVISAGANTGTNPGERLTLSGVVTQNVSGNDFYFRANDGRPFRVRTRSAEPRWIVAGARIEVRGLRDRNERDLIYADSLRQLSNQNSSVDRRVSFLGTVSRLQSQTRFNVLAKDGRTYTVSATGISHSRISVGDRVRVVGLPTTDRTTIAAESVTMVSDGNTGTASSTANGTVVNFPGRIEAVGSTLRVRGDNGQSYVVRFSAWQKFRVGDRVRVIGTVKNGVVTASSVTNL